MSTAHIKGSPRKLLASFVSTLSVGSSWASSVIDLRDFKSVVGICKTTSSNLTVAFAQSAVTSAFDVSSAVAIAPGLGIALNWTGLADYAQLSVSAVNSTQGETMRLHIYGVPI